MQCFSNHLNHYVNNIKKALYKFQHISTVANNNLSFDASLYCIRRITKYVELEKEANKVQFKRKTLHFMHLLIGNEFVVPRVLDIVSFWQVNPIRVSEINLCRWVVVYWCFGSSDRLRFRIDLYS